MSPGRGFSANCFMPRFLGKRIGALKSFILQRTCVYGVPHFCGSSNAVLIGTTFPRPPRFSFPSKLMRATRGSNRVSSLVALVLQTADDSVSLAKSVSSLCLFADRLTEGDSRCSVNKKAQP
jgi:hypothetical protein